MRRCINNSQIRLTGSGDCGGLILLLTAAVVALTLLRRRQRHRRVMVGSDLSFVVCLAIGGLSAAAVVVLQLNGACICRRGGLFIHVGVVVVTVIILLIVIDGCLILCDTG